MGITGKEGMCDGDLPLWDWKSFALRDELLERQIAQINVRFNQKINLVVPSEVRKSIRGITDQARWIGGSTELKEFGERLHAAIPADVRERVNALRRARHREILLVVCRHYRTIASVHNRSLLVRGVLGA